jgi:copper transport protein
VRGLALLLPILAALASASAAHSHASLIRSEPAERAVVAEPPVALTLLFNEPVSSLTLKLARPGGEVIELRNVATDGSRLTVALPAGLTSGTHLLSWRVTSADGHPVGGSLTFSIGYPSAEASTKSEAGDDPQRRAALWFAKFVLYVGLFVGIGGAFYAGWIARQPIARRLQRSLAVVLDCGLAAAVVSVGIQGADALGVALSSLRDLRVWTAGFATSHGTTAAIAGLALVLGRAALGRNGGKWLAMLALAGTGTALAASGHASAAAPQWLTRPAVFVHAVSVAFWTGALVPLGCALHAGRIEELQRFSRAIPLPLGLLVASGLVLAVVQLRQIDALWTTDYGFVLSVKLAAVAVLLMMAAGNRLATSRAMAGGPCAVRAIGVSACVEAAVIVLVLGLVATWRFTPPPRALLDAARAPVHLHLHSGKAMADIKIERTRDGGRFITLVVLDGQFGPLPAKEVTLTLAKPDAGIEPLRLHATHVAESMWTIEDVRIPLPGRWRMRVDILIDDFEKAIIEDDFDVAR